MFRVRKSGMSGAASSVSRPGISWEEAVRRAAALLTALGAVALSGCGTAEPPDTRTAAADDVPRVSSEERCAREEGHPIPVDVAITTIRSHGITVAPEWKPDCVRGQVAQLTNVHFRGPNENIRDHDAVGVDEGHVLCKVSNGPQWRPDLQRLQESKNEYDFYVANLWCSIYTEDATREPNVAALESAMEDLRRYAATRS
jgi:hypothetical protein